MLESLLIAVGVFSFFLGKMYGVYVESKRSQYWLKLGKDLESCTEDLKKLANEMYEDLESHIKEERYKLSQNSLDERVH